MSTPTYGALCATHYALSRIYPPADMGKFYKQYAHNAQGPILEPMCGAGQFLIPLRKAGYAIAGYDASPHMLAQLHARAAVEQLPTPNVWQQRIEHPAGPESYALILIPGGSFSLLIEEQTVQQALHQLYQQLQPGGTLIFEIETALPPQTSFYTWEGQVVYPDDTSLLVYSKFILPPANSRYTVLCKYEYVVAGNLIQTEVEERTFRLYTAQALRQPLHQIGFSAVQLVKAYQVGQAPSVGDACIVYVCTK